MILQHFNPDRIDHLKKCVISKFLGDGAFGLVEVYQCKQLHNEILCNRLFVVKRIKKKYGFCNYTRKKHIERLYNEYNIGILLNHENIRKTFIKYRKNYTRVMNDDHITNRIANI